MSVHEAHEHCCEHKEVKYCKVCKVVYCKGCGREWREYQYYYPTYRWTSPTDLTYETFPFSTTLTGCSHK